MNALYHTLQENPSKCNRLTFKCNALHLFLHFNSIEHCRNLKYIPFICKTDRSIVFFYHFTNTLNTMPMSDIIFLGCFQAFIFLSCFAVCYYKKQNPGLVLFSIFTKRCPSGTLLQASTALSTRFPYNTPISP